MITIVSKEFVKERMAAQYHFETEDNTLMYKEKHLYQTIASSYFKIEKM